MSREEARRLTRWPGIGMVLAGLVSILVNLLGVLVNVGHFFGRTRHTGIGGREVAGLSLEVGWYAPWILLSLLICLGGVQLIRVRTSWIVWLSVVLCFVPCVTNCFALVVTIPVAIWVIATLRKKPVICAFGGYDEYE